MQKVYVRLVTSLVIEAEEGVPIDEIIGDMKYECIYKEPDYGEITDFYITSWQIIDSK